MAFLIHEMAVCLLDYFGQALYHPEKVILSTEIISLEIFHAMGFAPFAVELPAFLLPLLEPYALSQYIDTSENYGIPPDICTLLKGAMGLILKKHLMKGHAVIATNLPCDTHLCTDTLLESETDTPFFRLDEPYQFTTEKAADYFAGELSGMINWLEYTTGRRMDWEKLRRLGGGGGGGALCYHPHLRGTGI